MRNYKICLFAFIGTPNLGDEAIFYSMMSSFIRMNYFVSILSRDPVKTYRLLNDIDSRKFKVFNVRKIIEVYNAIKNSDVFVCGGGGIIHDQTNLYSTALVLIKAIIAKLLKRKIMFYGIGVMPVRFSLNKFLTKTILNLAKVISVRDCESKNILVGLGVKENLIRITSDPAVNLKEISNEETINILIENRIDLNKPIMVVCMRNFFDKYRLVPPRIVKKLGIQTRKNRLKYKNFITKISTVLNYCKDELNYQLVFIPFRIGRDDVVHDDIIAKMNNKKGVFCLNWNISPRQVKGIIKYSSFVLGMRLHSIIFASTHKVPFVSITYADKIRYYLMTLFPENSIIEKISVNPEKFSEDDLKDKINYALDSKSSILDLTRIEEENLSLLEGVLANGHEN